MDYDLLLKIGLKYETKSITDILAKFRLHDSSKTVAQGVNFFPEEFFVLDSLLKNYFSIADPDNKIINEAGDQGNGAKYGLISKNELMLSGEKSYSNTMVEQMSIVSAYTHMIWNVIRFSNSEVIKETKDFTNDFLNDSLVDPQNLKSEQFFYWMCEKLDIDLSKTTMSESEYYALNKNIRQAYHTFNQRYQIIQNENNCPDPQWMRDQQIKLLHIIFDSKNKSLSKSLFLEIIRDNPQIIVQKRMLIFVIKYVLPYNIIYICQGMSRKIRTSLGS